jgi:hypothetical protein
MKSSIELIMTAAALLSAGTAGAQDETTPYYDPTPQYTNVASYSISVPFGDTRSFISTPSWLGINWEGQWTVGQKTVAGVGVGFHDFFDRSSGTTHFDNGAATGEKLRDLLVASVMGIGRWYPAGVGRGMHLGLGLGGIFVQQTYRLGVIPQLVHHGFHVAVAPEAGMAIRLFDGVDVVTSARYTLPGNAGPYLANQSRRFQYLTLSIGLAEH